MRAVSALIRFWTFGPFSHVELVFPHYYLTEGNSFSSSGVDGGVRYKKINYSHPERWQFIDFEVTSDEMQDIRQKCDKLVGKLYDFRGIFGFLLLHPDKIQSDNRWWCSEVVCYVLNIRPFRISPNAMFRKLRSGYVYRGSAK